MNTKLEFTPLEFETDYRKSFLSTIALEFTPLEFETAFCDVKVLGAI